MDIVISIVALGLLICIWAVLWRTRPRESRIAKFLEAVIRNNSGVSMKNFILLLGGILVSFSVVAFICLLYLDFFFEEKTISISYYGYAAIIAAIEGLLGLLFFLKVKSERYEHVKDINKMEADIKDNSNIEKF